MKRFLFFYALWLVANLVGFPLGNLLGGDRGLVSGIPGNLLYGLAFGLLQGAVLFLWRERFGAAVLAWPILTAVGFTVGVRLGAHFSFDFSSEPAYLGIIFGLFVGAGVSLAQSLVRFSPGTRGLAWLPASLLAWVIGEILAFASGFQPGAVPLVGLGIGAVSGLGYYTFARTVDLKADS